ALLDTRVARQEAAALELGTKVRIGLEQRAGDAVAQRAGLGGDTAAVHRGDDVHARLVADRLERLADRALQRLAREERLERLAVDDVLAGAGLERDARDGRLALARGAVAGAGGEVDRRVGDRLRQLVVVVVGGLVVVLLDVVLAVARTVGQGLFALADDVDLEVHAGDRRLHARRLVDLFDL